LQAGSTSESNTAHSQALPKGVCLGACSSWTQAAAAMNMQLAPNQRRKLGDCKPSHLWGPYSFGAIWGTEVGRFSVILMVLILCCHNSTSVGATSVQ